MRKLSFACRSQLKWHLSEMRRFCAYATDLIEIIP